MTATSTRGADWDTPVLIVGGMVSGLSTALFLAHHGIESTVVERRADTMRHPRIRGISARTVELFRQVGLEPALREIDDSADEGSRIILAESLAGPEIQELVPPYEEVEEGISPAGELLCDQDLLEPVLLEHVRGAGARVLFGSELVSFEQDGSGVRAVVRSVGSGVERVVRAGYLVACDGARSPVRERLGIARGGPGDLGRQLTVLFEADLDEAVRGRHFSVCLVERLPGASLTPRQRGRWQLTMPCGPVPDGTVETFPPERCAELVREAVGLPGLCPVIRWARVEPVTALVAERFRRGRVFLAGEAAHVMPATGGLSGNTGIQDVHNLAWKLAAVTRRTAGEELLETYERERRPIAVTTMEDHVARAAVVRSLTRAETSPASLPRPHDYNSVAFGARYHSDALVEERFDDGDALEDPLHPTGRPGVRAGHVPVLLDGRAISLLDLYGHAFVLLAGEAGAVWCEAAKRAATALDVAVMSYVVGPDGRLRDRHDRLRRVYGLSRTGAVLVRPDGVIAWRTTGGADDPHEKLEGVLRRILHRGRTAV